MIKRMAKSKMYEFLDTTPPAVEKTVPFQVASLIIIKRQRKGRSFGQRLTVHTNQTGNGHLVPLELQSDQITT
jgi:hypothetical protein